MAEEELQLGHSPSKAQADTAFVNLSLPSLLNGDNNSHTGSRQSIPVDSVSGAEAHHFGEWLWGDAPSQAHLPSPGATPGLGVQRLRKLGEPQCP